MPPEPLIAPKMDNFRRDLMFRVISGDVRVIPIVYQIDQFKDCDKILRWLIANSIVGYQLFEWLKLYHGNSPLRMVTHIINLIERNANVKRRLYANRDLK